MEKSVLSVLIVDDSLDDADILGRYLRGLDEYDVRLTMATNPAQAMNELATRSVDIVFLDYLLGCDTGAEMLETMRAGEDDRPVVAMTGVGDERVAAEIMRAGADEYLVKGEMNTESCRRVIQSALQRCRLRRAKREAFDRKMRQAERLATIGQTVASLSHTIKGIMTALKGSAYLIDQAIAQQEYYRIPELWTVYQRNSERISQLTTQMLNYSREPQPQFEKGNLNDVAKQLVEDFTPEATRLKVRLELRLQPNLPQSSFDRGMLTDALQGVIENALQACEGVPNGRVTVSTVYQAPLEFVKITVSDNGPGVDTEVMDQIFDPFFSTKGTKGTGLGLAITHKAVVAHGGTIDFNSRPGRTIFSILLPLQPAGANSLGMDSLSASVDGTGFRTSGWMRPSAELRTETSTGQSAQSA